MSNIDLRGYSFLDSLQPQYAAFLERFISEYLEVLHAEKDHTLYQLKH